MSIFVLCVWAEIPGRPGFFDCLHCGLPFGHPKGQRGPRPYPANVRRECRIPGLPAQQPALTPPPPVRTRVRNYLTAREKWIAAGKPLRDDVEKRKLYDICLQCPSGEYREGPFPLLAPGMCAVCGCGLHPERNVANKIAWRTEDCPRGHWPSEPK